MRTKRQIQKIGQNDITIVYCCPATENDPLISQIRSDSLGHMSANGSPRIKRNTNSFSSDVPISHKLCLEDICDLSSERCDFDSRTIDDFSIRSLHLVGKNKHPRDTSMMCKTLVRSDFIDVWAGCFEYVLGEQFFTDVRLVSRLHHKIGAKVKIEQHEGFESRG
jgi:hypothetical protein